MNDEINRQIGRLQWLWKCYHANNWLIVSYTLSKQDYNVKLYKQENKMLLQEIKEAVIDLNFEKDRNNRRVINTQKRNYSDPFKISESQSIDWLDRIIENRF